jgi:hypothetical protein
MNNMKRKGHELAKMFVGPEVEHSPAFSKKTLFVVGEQPLQQIVKYAKEYKTPHIFMGANHSFDPALAEYWKLTITYLLDHGYWVTLDYPAHLHEFVLTMFTPGVWQCRTFVPLLSVRIPNFETSSPNLTIKFDDVDFKATNRGVWCHHYHEVADSNRFTDWGDYGSDFVIENVPDIGQVHILPAKVKVPEEVQVNIIPIDTPVEVTVKVEEVVKIKKPKIAVDPLGIDPVPTTALKPEEGTATATEVLNTINSTVDPAALYAEGTTKDPIAEAAPKKTKSKKTAE